VFVYVWVGDMNIELRFKEREVIKRVDGDGPFPVIVKILQFRQGPTMTRMPTIWKDVPCVGVDDD